MGRAREGQEPGECAADRSPPRHQTEQDQGEAQRAHHLDERVATRECGAEDHPVGEVDDPAERDADRVGEPVGPARVIDEVVGDQGARGPDGAEREVQHPGRAVEHDQPDAGERIDASERETEDDEGLDELEVHAEDADGEETGHRKPPGAPNASRFSGRASPAWPATLAARDALIVIPSVVLALPS